VEHFLGALAILVVLYFSWQPNRQVNDSWRLAAKLMEFPWRSTLGGFCLAAGRPAAKDHFLSGFGIFLSGI